MRTTLLLLLLSACQKGQPWTYAELPTSEARCARLMHRTRDPVQGMDLELLKVAEDEIAYLTLHSTPLSSKEPLVRLTSGGKTYAFPAKAHEGGQRIRLPHAMKVLLIESLEKGHSVTLDLESYRETIPPFKSKNPPRKLPLHLSF